MVRPDVFLWAISSDTLQLKKQLFATLNRINGRRVKIMREIRRRQYNDGGRWHRRHSAIKRRQFYMRMTWGKIVCVYCLAS